MRVWLERACNHAVRAAGDILPFGNETRSALPIQGCRDRCHCRRAHAPRRLHLLVRTMRSGRSCLWPCARHAESAPSKAQRCFFMASNERRVTTDVSDSAPCSQYAPFRSKSANQAINPTKAQNALRATISQYTSPATMLPTSVAARARRCHDRSLAWRRLRNTPNSAPRKSVMRRAYLRLRSAKKTPPRVQSRHGR